MPSKNIERSRRPGALILAVGGVLLVIFLVAGLLAHHIVPHGPSEQNLSRKLEPPSLEYPLGTDTLGRCLFSRILYGIRSTLGLAASVTVLVVVIGVAVGLSCVVFPRLDAPLMRLTDCFFAFPSIVLILVTISILGPGVPGMILALSLPGWPKYARVVRSVGLGIREMSFIEATQALGAGRWYIFRRCYLPGILAPVLTIATIGIGGKIVSIAGLGVLGLGIQPPTPEWGSMLNQGLPMLRYAPHVFLASGGVIVLAILAFTLTGEGLRDIIDPQIKEQGEPWRI